MLTATAVQAYTVISIHNNGGVLMDCKSEEFKNSLCQLIANNIAIARARKKILNEMAADEIRQLVDMRTNPDGEGLLTIPPEMQEASQELSTLTEQQLSSLVDFALVQGAEGDQTNIRGKRNWIMLAITLSLYFPLMDSALKKKGFSIDAMVELLRETELDENGYPVKDSLLFQIIRSAKNALRKKGDPEEPEVESIVVKQASHLVYPLDKVNSYIWQDFAPGELGYSLEIDVAKSGSKDHIPISYSIDFAALDGLPIAKNLTTFDKRVYCAAASLYEGGNNDTTPTQIYKTMGQPGKPSTDQINKIKQSLLKMRAAQIFIDTRAEADAYNYEHTEYEGSLLPTERCTKRVNGRITKDAVHFLREPPLIEFAKGRKQVTSIAISVLQSPVSQSETILRVEDYLLNRISRARKKPKETILLQTLFNEARITEKKAQGRIIQKVKTLLTHYKKTDFIADFSITPRSIIVENKKTGSASDR